LLEDKCYLNNYFLEQFCTTKLYKESPRELNSHDKGLFKKNPLGKG